MTPEHDPVSAGVARNVTTQGEEAEALRRERDLLSAVLDTAGALVVVLDRQGRIVRFNRACERAIGYSFEEVEGQALWDLFIVPEEIAPVLAVFEQLRAGHFPNQHENHWLTKDGARRLIAWSNTALLGAGDTVEYVIGTGIDITERQQVEAQRDAALHLQQRLASEALVARISTEFVNLGPAEIDIGIQHALQAIGELAGVDRSYVFQFSGDGTVLDNTHEWCSEGIQPYMDSLKGLPRAAFPWFVGRLEQLEVVSVPCVADLPPEASSERAECEKEGIRSILLAPLAYRGMLVGFLGFDSVRGERNWEEGTIALLTTAAGIIVNALEHKRAQAIQAGQRQFLELLATGGGFSETLQTLVRLIEDQWPGMLGLILLLDEDGKHLHIGASMSLPQDYVQSIEGLEIGPMVGSCGTACYRRERVIVEDTATDPRWEGLRDLALQYSLRACWSEPVFSPDDQVVGTFAMYYRQPRAPTEGELSAIEMGAHLVGVAVEHRRAEQALRESEEKFRGIVELANVGIAIVQDARFRFVNPHWASMLGYTVEEMLGREFMPYCTPEERDRIVDYYRRRTRGEPAPTRYATVMLHKDGTRVYAEVSVGMIPYEGRLATFVFLRDITEQKRVEDALRQSERRFRAVFEGAPIGVSMTSLEGQLLETNRALQQMFGYTGAEFYNLDVEAFSHPEDMVEDAGLFYGELVPGKRDGYQIEKRLIRRDGEMFWGRLSLSLARGDRGEPLFAIATTEDITERKQAQDALLEAYETLEQRVEERTRQLTTLVTENARLYRAEQSRLAEAERRRLVAEGMREILAALNSKQALDDTLNLIASHACQVLGSDAAALLRLDRATGLLGIQATCNLDAKYATQIRMPLGVGTAGRALAERRPVVIPDTAEAADYMRAGGLDRPEIVPDLLRQLTGRFRALFSVPIIVKDEAHGAITFYYREPHHFPDEEFRLAMSVADQVALAIENARLREQAGQAATMEERGRLARELHDSVTQSLYSVTMYAEAAARLMTSGQAAEAAEYLRDARDTAQEALREMRLMIYQLRPPVLEKGGLAVALQVRLDAVERRGGIHAELTVEGDDRLPPAIQAELHQIAQEALNNALKHAHAHQVQVHLHFGDALTRLQVVDDGVGFDPEAKQAEGGLGLPGMRERAQRIGGWLKLHSAPGRGTQVIVDVPTGGGR